MTHYKGGQSSKAIEKDFPHIVEMILPEGGFGKTLDAMYDFHARHGIRAINSTGRRDWNGRDYIRWCFADPAIAEARASSNGCAQVKISGYGVIPCCIILANPIREIEGGKEIQEGKARPPGTQEEGAEEGEAGQESKG